MKSIETKIKGKNSHQTSDGIHNMMDRVALVTGSSRGLGRDIAGRLAECVSAVGIHYFSNRKTALESVRQLNQTGVRSEAFRADLRKEKEASDLIERVEATFGRIDILVNNVGPILVKSWDLLTEADWDSVLDGNLKSSYWCTKAALPGMRKRRWGRIINIGYSRAEQITAFSKILPYAVAKTGLLILTRSAAASEVSKGITVNMVSPGLMEGGVLPPDSKVPAGRLGTFADVSSAVQFLVSEDAGYITGAHLTVAGGWKL